MPLYSDGHLLSVHVGIHTSLLEDEERVRFSVVVPMVAGHIYFDFY